MHFEDYAGAAEWIETQALSEFHQAAPDATRAALGLERIELGGAHLFIARHDPNIMLNRILGLGMNRPATEELLGQIRDYYTAAGVDDYFLHVQPRVRPPRLWNWLFDAGMARDRGWTQFIRGTQPVTPRPTTLRVERIGRDHAFDFARIAADGFDLSEAAVPALAGMVGLPGWYHFMSFDGDRPVGTGALRVAKELAWFDWAATDPQFRGRGSQSLLLAQRIRTALELGCSTLLSETGEAVPGDPQHSFQNLVRAGFIPTHIRENFVPCATPSGSGHVAAH